MKFHDALVIQGNASRSRVGHFHLNGGHRGEVGEEARTAAAAANP